MFTYLRNQCRQCAYTRLKGVVGVKRAEQMLLYVLHSISVEFICFFQQKMHISAFLLFKFTDLHEKSVFYNVYLYNV